MTAPAITPDPRHRCAWCGARYEKGVGVFCSRRCMDEEVMMGTGTDLRPRPAIARVPDESGDEASALDLYQRLTLSMFQQYDERIKKLEKDVAYLKGAHQP
jgi:hypothetical protein